MRMAWIVGFVALCPIARASGDEGKRPASAEMLRWFQSTEQALMDSIAVGDKGPWERIIDPACIVTSEEGDVVSRKQFLDDLGPLPAGLTGSIAVKELTVDELPGIAVVRYLADESEAVFGQRLATRYRVTDTFWRRRRGWKMVASHTSVVTQDPPAQEVLPRGLARLRRRVPSPARRVDLHRRAARRGALRWSRSEEAASPSIPLRRNAFVVSGGLGEWLFVTDEQGKVRILDFRKFEPLVWTRVDEGTPQR